MIPQDFELHSVISEEEENIMSTGGAIDEDGINQSVVYPSSIHSARRKLGGASDSDFAAVQIVDTFTPNESLITSGGESKCTKMLLAPPKVRPNNDMINVTSMDS